MIRNASEEHRNIKKKQIMPSNNFSAEPIKIKMKS